jgi:hypothetical protein
MELANEELERAQQRAAELALERDSLVQRLEAAHEEIEAVAAAAGMTAEEEGQPQGSDEGQQQNKEDGLGVVEDGGRRSAAVSSGGVGSRSRWQRKGKGNGRVSGEGEDGEGFWERQVGAWTKLCLCKRAKRSNILPVFWLFSCLRFHMVANV